ncbi:MAG: RnfABCDGE type electron transport complex subunit B [Bacillota bacterium]
MIPAVMSLAVIGFIFGGLLAFAGQKFAVEEDPRIDEINNVLPGANCGGCGFPGCRNFAEAVVNGKAQVDGCPVGRTPVAAAVAAIMGEETSGSDPLVARVYCQGKDGVAVDKAIYRGIVDCAGAAALSGGGPKACPAGCLGLGSCERACPFDAISMQEGVAVVDIEICTGCGKCVKVCPKGLLILAPKTKPVHVLCLNTERGAVARKNCQVACIGCRVCVRVCKPGAITVDNNLATINYPLCDACGACVEKCPTKCLVMEMGEGQAAAAS